ncbi:MAG: nucleotidyltransferase family protein [Nitrospirae bacterium]|nr:nucleotidyltransferase family protein [Magnetococcales bacterium]HAT50315.1 DNA polymerase subunit beta [Alphaproteobacteria bacterium]
MKLEDVMQQLVRHKEYLRQEFGIIRLSLFGSMARDDAREGSDVDLLVAFDGPATSARYFGAQFYLEDLLGCPVDLVTEKGLRSELRPFIEREALHV